MSAHPDVAGADEFAPLGVLCGEEGGPGLHRRRLGRFAHRLPARCHVGRPERGRRDRVKPPQGRLRSAAGREHRKLLHHLEAREAELLEGRHVRSVAAALARRRGERAEIVRGERAEIVRGDQRHGRDGGRHEHAGLAGEHRRQGGPAAATARLLDGDARHLLEQLDGQVRRRAHT